MKIELYQSEIGKIPFQKWLKDLNVKDRARIFARLDRVTMNNLGDYKSLGLGLYELRFPYGPGYRVYFGWDGKLWVLLLAGGSKSTQKGDIRKARTYWIDYQNRRKV